MPPTDTTATIISYTAFKAGKARVHTAPVIDCLGGEVLDDKRPPLIAAPGSIFEDGPQNLKVHEQDERAAQMSIREKLMDAASFVFEDEPRPSQGFDIEVIAARGRDATFVVLRLRHAPALL